jgi:fructokinase
MIDRFLIANHVNTEYVYRYYNGKSSLALAFLNENNDASYDFYKIYPKERLVLDFPVLQQDDIVLFGSLYAITNEVRQKILQFISDANRVKAIVLYDPNFRKSHLHELARLKPLIIENFGYANLIRGSNEDFSFILGTCNADETYAEIKPHCSHLLYTANTKGVFVRSPGISETFSVKSIDPLSTIGAGDNFNAGVIYSFYKYNIGYSDLDHLSASQWKDIVSFAVDFATHVCMSYDNYIAVDFARKYSL